MDPTTALHDAARAIEEIERKLLEQPEWYDEATSRDRALVVLRAVAQALRKNADESARAGC